MLKSASVEWREIRWDQALRGASPKVADALEKALAGTDLGFEAGLTLANVEGEDLLALVKVADEIRRRVVGDRGAIAALDEMVSRQGDLEQVHQQIDDHARHRHIHPDRPRPARDSTMACETAARKNFKIFRSENHQERKESYRESGSM